MGRLLRLLARVGVVEPEGERRDSMPEIAALDDGRVDLGRCDVYELLVVIEDVLPRDAVLRLESPHGEPRAFLERNAPLANGNTYDLPLSSPAFPEFQALAARSAAPEIGIHVLVHGEGRMLLEAYDCADDTRIASDLPAEALVRLRETIRS